MSFKEWARSLRKEKSGVDWNLVKMIAMGVLIVLGVILILWGSKLVGSLIATVGAGLGFAGTGKGEKLIRKIRKEAKDEAEDIHDDGGTDSTVGDINRRRKGRRLRKP